MRLRVVLAVIAGISMAGSFACKQRTPSQSQLKDDSATVRAMPTSELINYLHERAESGAWDWEVNVDAFNEDVQGAKIKSQDEAFGRPYNEVLACPDSQKVMFDGQPACATFDNLMTFDYAKGKRRSKGYVNIIPQQMSEDQPHMKRFIQEGDLIVYFHPERREGALDSEEMQWRASHAATVVMRDGKLGTADTPAGYAKPFTGVDPTPFHVFRFMPKDDQGKDLPEDTAQNYRRMIAKWATLGFDQFNFTGSYDTAASQLKGPGSIKTFADWYIKAATTPGGVPKCDYSRRSDCFPQMYCAWFVFNNLNLAWMHPLNTMSNLPAGDFTNIRQGFQYGGSRSVSSYLADTDGLKAHGDFVFRPLTAYGLIHGFLVRLLGEDDPTDPVAFVGRAMNKAKVLAGVAANSQFVSTFSSQPGYVPNYDQARADEINQKIPQIIGKFAERYQAAAAAVQARLEAGDAAGAVTLAGELMDGPEGINRLYHANLDSKETELRDYTKRWIPPYAYAYVAEGYHPQTPDRKEMAEQGKRPVLAYVGTVLHQKYVKKSGSGDSGPSLVMMPAKAATAEDRELDKKMYRLAGFAEAPSDMKGYQYFMECLAKVRTRCSPKIRQFFNEYERDAVLGFASTWMTGTSFSEDEARTRNTFGLDAVLLRRLLAAYWNDPSESFRPNIFNHPAPNDADPTAMSHVIINFRILYSTPVAMNDEQGVEGQVQTARRMVMPCLPGRADLPVNRQQPPGCGYTIRTGSNATFAPPAGSAETDGDHGAWPARLHKDEGGSAAGEENGGNGGSSNGNGGGTSGDNSGGSTGGEPAGSTTETGRILYQGGRWKFQDSSNRKYNVVFSGEARTKFMPSSNTERTKIRSRHGGQGKVYSVSYTGPKQAGVSLKVFRAVEP